MTTYIAQARQLGDELIADHARGQIRAFFDQIRHGARDYQTVASLNAQIAQEYRGRCILELLQNAHDALANAVPDDPRRISFVLSTDPQPVLLVGNSGLPFRHADFKGICELAQSRKNPNESVGNKGLGFRSVLEVSSCPEIWSTGLAAGAPCFAFRFDPAVTDLVAEAAQELKLYGLDARSPLEDCPLVDWSPRQLEDFRQRLKTEGIDVAEAAGALSPYAIPLRAERMPLAVRCLLDEGHATVVRLPLDSEEAIPSVKDQLAGLRDARSVIFLDHLGELVIEVDGERRVLERGVDSDAGLAGSLTCQRRLRVKSATMATGSASSRRFHMWTRVVGGDDDPDGAAKIRDVVEHLPNRWPEVRQATVGVAVEETLASSEGVFVIFLPTVKTTGTGAHINAPFYGSVDRRQIDFNVAYNKLLLNSVLDLCLDAVRALVVGQPEGWQARAVLDILSSVAMVTGEDWALIDKLREIAAERGYPLGDQTVVLCDDGWRTPHEARMMPDLDDDNPIGADRWRKHAAFAVVSTELDCRKDAVRSLIEDLNGLPNPTDPEWAGTIKHMAAQVRDSGLDIGWDEFLRGLLAVLPNSLRWKPPIGPDPLVDTPFVPTDDGRLVATSDATKLFFQPVQGVDEVADLVAVPEVLRERIAFLHHDVRTQEGQPRSNTQVQTFLSGRFALSFEREDILQNVVIPALPPLPARHGSQEASDCAAILAWTLKLLGDRPGDTSLQLLGGLPVPCYGGWQPMAKAAFGPGWHGTLGTDLRALVDDLPDAAAERLSGTMLVPPNSKCWQGLAEGRGELLVQGGVVDGLRLSTVSASFFMTRYWSICPDAPDDTPVEAWNDWFETVEEKLRTIATRSRYEYRFQIQLLPEIHHLKELSRQGCLALSRLILASIGHWDTSWTSVDISKMGGRRANTSADSPLKHWLRTFAWLNDDVESSAKPLSQRWLVPELLIRGQRERYAHIDPLSQVVAHELNVNSTLLNELKELGLNVYPTENDDRIGPELLDALANAWAGGRILRGRFDVFLGQVRDAWRHLDHNKGLPQLLLVRTGRRSFSTRAYDELADVYLPDNRERTRTLLEHGKEIVEMTSGDANRMAEIFSKETSVRKASLLEQRHVIDGALWAERGNDHVEGAMPLGETKFRWLPEVLLAIAAYGGANPAGTTTNAWNSAKDRLRRTRVLDVNEITVELVEDELLGSTEPRAQWLPDGEVLAVRRDLSSYRELAPAVQALLERQDLLKDLRSALGELSGQKVTTERVELALTEVEIESEELADVRNRWIGDTSLVVDRIRPVLMLLEVRQGWREEFEEAGVDFEHLKRWLSSNLPQRSTADLLSAAHEAADDHAMGMAAWKSLGNVAQLPAFNDALAKLGGRYETVRNHEVAEQTRAHLEEAKVLLRSFARHVAEATDPNLFPQIEEVYRDFSGPAYWATQWWEVPFDAVLDTLRGRFARIAGVEPHLSLLDGALTVDDLRDQFEREGIAHSLNPYEIASENMKLFEGVLAHVRDIHQTWMELESTNETQRTRSSEPASPPASAYLRRWSDVELLKRALDTLCDVGFKEACAGCSTLDTIRQRLGVAPDQVESRREKRRRSQEQEARNRRIFDVAGAPFEVGSSEESYRALFDRLGELSVPEGPLGELTPLVKMRRRGREGRGGGGGTVSAVRRAPAELRELIGIVGEIRAFHYLRKRFGEEAVSREAWVSETRRKVLPLVAGEPDDVSDGHGFDFQFVYKRKKWHVEVKATDGNDSQFELGISEIRAANHFARKKVGLWLILRIRYARSDYPEFDWLPNPFEEGYKELYQFHQDGMRVSYSMYKR